MTLQQQTTEETNNASRVIIISGFLGSGKTTLLKKLVAYDIARGGQPHIIMSEFGDIDIDGFLVREEKVLVTTITGGCACCDLREQLSDAVRDAVIVSPKSTIIIESTGVGDPAGILKAIQPYSREGIVAVSACVTVYDAGRSLLTGKDGNLIQRQLKTADIVVVNKADTATQEAIQTVLGDIGDINSFAELVVTSHGEIEFGKVFDGKSVVTGYEVPETTSDTFRSLGFYLEEPLSGELFEKWLKKLPASVVRVKGFVRLAGEPGIFEVQATPGQTAITPFTKEEKPPAMLVVITHPMRVDGLVNGLTKCISE